MEQSQLELLWLYQEEDMKADRIANEIKKSPTRQKLEKSRDFIIEQQKLYKQIEEQVSVMSDRKDAIRDAITRCEDQLAAVMSRFESTPPEDLESARAMMAEAAKYQETIAAYEKEMRRILKDSNDQDLKQRNIRHEAAKVKVDFDRLKKVYDEELAGKKAELEAQRAVAKKKAVGISADLMEEYNTIKKHIVPPMARLLNDQCSGCNTALPSALLRKIKSGTEIVECETCGRMIIL